MKGYMTFEAEFMLVVLGKDKTRIYNIINSVFCVLPVVGVICFFFSGKEILFYWFWHKLLKVTKVGSAINGAMQEFVPTSTPFFHFTFPF